MQAHLHGAWLLLLQLNRRAERIDQHGSVVDAHHVAVRVVDILGRNVADVGCRRRRRRRVDIDVDEAIG